MGEPESNTRNNETTKMMDHGFNQYSVEKLIGKDEKVGTIELNKSDKRKIDVVTKQDVVVLNETGKEKRNTTRKIQLDNLTVPIKKGQKVGTLQILENGKVINEVDVTVREDINKINVFKLYLRHIEDIFAGYMNV